MIHIKVLIGVKVCQIINIFIVKINDFFNLFIFLHFAPKFYIIINYYKGIIYKKMTKRT